MPELNVCPSYLDHILHTHLNIIMMQSILAVKLLFSVMN